MTTVNKVNTAPQGRIYKPGRGFTVAALLASLSLVACGSVSPSPIGSLNETPGASEIQNPTRSTAVARSSQAPAVASVTLTDAPASCWIITSLATQDYLMDVDSKGNVAIAGVVNPGDKLLDVGPASDGQRQALLQAGYGSTITQWENVKEKNGNGTNLLAVSGAKEYAKRENC